MMMVRVRRMEEVLVLLRRVLRHPPFSHELSVLLLLNMRHVMMIVSFDGIVRWI